MTEHMTTFEIATAVRKATPALIGLWGPSGAGKTLSALKLARGLVGPKGMIGLVDTENCRAEFYAAEAGGWDHIDLQPPFTPTRYSAAFKAFESKSGYGCVIVDSMSHVWQGEGGVIDMAENSRTQSGAPMQGLAKWKAPKMAYMRMVNDLLRAPFHVIFCLRAKDGVRQRGRGASAEIESTGLEPICEKNFIYEMTVAVLLGPDHKPLFQPIDRFFCNSMIPAVKAPEDLIAAIKPGEFLSETTGRAIADWVGGGAAVDEEAERERRLARETAMLGTEQLNKYWGGLEKIDRAFLLPIMDDLRAISKQADEGAGQETPGVDEEDPFGLAPLPDEKPGEDSNPLNDPFTETEQPETAE